MLYPRAPAAALLLFAGLAAGLAAQRAPVFTLPAGPHDVRELVELASTIGKTPIASDEPTLARAWDRTVTLQRELQLDADAWLDVVATLLFHRGLLLAPGAPGGPQRVVALADAGDLFAEAPRRTPEDVLARASRMQIVTTTVACAPDQVPLRINPLRPVFAMQAGGTAMRIAAVEGGIGLTGPIDQVALAIRVLAVCEGRDPAPVPAVAWDGDAPQPWPGGTMTLQSFLQLLAERLDANVLAETVADGVQLDLGDAAELPRDAWFARATHALHAARLVLLPVAEPHRLFALRAMDGPHSKQITWRSRFVTPAAACDPAAAILPVFAVFEPRHADVGAFINGLRPMMAGSGTVFGVLSPHRLCVWGMRDQAAAMLAKLREIDEAAKKQ